MSKLEPNSNLKLEDYSAAALRHWSDAQLLERGNCFENADQLYGFAAECALKKALVELPAFAKNGMLDTTYKLHVNDLWYKVNHQSLQKRYASLYAVLKATSPFSDWHVDQRYLADGIVSLEAMRIHRDTAKRLLGTVGLTGQRK